MQPPRGLEPVNHFCVVPARDRIRAASEQIADLWPGIYSMTCLETSR